MKYKGIKTSLGLWGYYHLWKIDQTIYRTTYEKQEDKKQTKAYLQDKLIPSAVELVTLSQKTRLVEDTAYKALINWANEAIKI